MYVENDRMFLMSCESNIIDNVILVERYNEIVPARVLRFDKRRVVYKLLSGKDKGKYMSGKYDADHKIEVFTKDVEILAFF